MSSSIWQILPKQLSRSLTENVTLENDPFWSKYERTAQDVTIHIAILSRQYLELILNRDKTIESRFSINRRMPYKRVKAGDIILFKETGGFIHGLGYTSDVDFVQLSNGMSFDKIRQKYGDGLQIQSEDYWERYARSCYGTLIYLSHVRRLPPMEFSKRDRNAWVIFDTSTID